MRRIRLLVLNAALGVLDYRVPDGLTVGYGHVVVAPLGPRQVTGIVWEEERLPGESVPDAKLRPILSVLPVPPIRPELRRLIEWTADYYCAQMSSVARMVLASGGALKGGVTVTEYRLTGEEPDRMTPQRKIALEKLEGQQGTIRELAGIAGVSEGVLRGLVGQGVLEAEAVDADRPYRRARPDHAEPVLSPDQARVADELVSAVEAEDFAPILLDGVTGSGKTLSLIHI